MHGGGQKSVIKRIVLNQENGVESREEEQETEVIVTSSEREKTVFFKKRIAIYQYIPQEKLDYKTCKSLTAQLNGDIELIYV